MTHSHAFHHHTTTHVVNDIKLPAYYTATRQSKLKYIIMKSFSATIVAVSIFLSQDTTAFTSHVPSIIHHSSKITLSATSSEPEGGEELTKISSSLPGSRMKNLGVEDEFEGVFKFWLSATADGAMVKKFRLQTEKDASKKANFPGFRKVRYIMCLYFANILQMY